MLKYWFLLALYYLKFVTISILAVNPCDAIGKSSKNLTNQTFIFVENQEKGSIEDELLIRTFFKCYATGANIHYIVMQGYRVDNHNEFGVVKTSLKNNQLSEKELASNVQFIVSPALDSMFMLKLVKYELSKYLSIDLKKYEFVSLGICGKANHCSVYQSNSTLIIDRTDSLLYEKIAAAIDKKKIVGNQEFRKHLENDLSAVVMFSMIETYFMILAILLLGTRTKFYILEDFHLRHHQEDFNIPEDDDSENEENQLP
ncbi:unnamed protein product [Caenorhabditis angaria]|uniref:Uncharacterized protein n=1 Tax=Caenorhabditis angaria TaxID=860376 RepID=A0A9P1IX93_9PELO|nr:unnamed protein product [Caenorhabditis angaria]